MIRKIFHYILIAIAAVAPWGCTDHSVIPDTAGTLTLRFSNSENSRADEDTANNPETLIDNLIVAFYQQAAEETLPAVAVMSFSSLGEYNTATVSVNLTGKMVKDLFDDMEGNSCRMYVLANLPDEAAGRLPANPTIAEMKELAISTDFLAQRMPDSFVMAGEGTVRYASSKATGSCNLYRAAAKIRLNLQLPESVTAPGEAARWVPVTDGMKCLLVNGVRDAVAAPTGVWSPAEASAYFTGSLDEYGCYRDYKAGDGEYPFAMDVPLYTYPNSWSETTEEEHKTTITLIVPWKLEGSDTETRRICYYQVPVTSAELPHIDRNYSYTINLNVNMLGSLDPERPLPLDNRSYQVVSWQTEQIDVDIKGYRYLVVNPNVYTINNETEFEIPVYTSHPAEITNITITYQRFSYVSDGHLEDVGNVVNLKINFEQILETNRNSFMNPDGKQILTYDPKVIESNQDIITIHHPLTLWTAYYWNEDDGGSYQPVQLSGKTNTSDEEVRKSEEIADIYVPTDYPAYFPYVIKLHIEHIDNPNFAEDVTITQYPAMYIQADKNPNKILPGIETVNPPGNVYINGFNYIRLTGDHPQDQDVFGNLMGIMQSSTNKNSNMYIITTTQLTSEDYIIGDPRTDYYNNDLSGSDRLPDPTVDGGPAGVWCSEAEALYPDNTIRKLSYYYPTRETDETENMIAPIFRVASSWGAGSLNWGKSPILPTREWARRRAATYQELGYPAGRWRVPTFAEFKYIVQLSFDKKIPELFTEIQGYWTAQGIAWIGHDGQVYLKKDIEPDFQIGEDNFSYNVRPVYDEWYWSQFRDMGSLPDGEGGYKYTLGDMPRGAH